jgi:DnaJ family protein C protein 7
MALKRYAAAEADCQTVVTMQKAEPSAKTLARLGKCQLVQGKVAFANATLDAALALEPDNTSAKLDLSKCAEMQADMANIERDRGRADWALVSMGVDRISRKVEDVPLAWRLWRLEALLGRKPPRLDEATTLAKCARVSPYCRTVLTRKHSEIVRASPSNPDALYWRGMVMYRTGATDQAVTHWKEALRCDPDYTAAKAAWNLAKALEAKKDEGNAAFKAGQLDVAVVAYTEAMAIDDTNDAVTATLLSNRATARLKLKLYDDALADCDACLALQKDHVKACVAVLLIYLAMADRWRTGYELRASVTSPWSSTRPPSGPLSRPTKSPPMARPWNASSRPSSRTPNRTSSGPRCAAAPAGPLADLCRLTPARAQMKDHYKILGCDKSASEDEIKRAYRKASLQAHPDKPGGSEERCVRAPESTHGIESAARTVSRSSATRTPCSATLGGGRPSTAARTRTSSQTWPTLLRALAAVASLVRSALGSPVRSVLTVVRSLLQLWRDARRRRRRLRRCVSVGLRTALCSSCP